MSQVSIIDIEGSHPQIPTEFITDSGSAIPLANQLEILGNLTVAGNDPISTSGSGNTVEVNVQTSQAIAASDATKVGLAAFNSAMFTVDANGFVTFSGGSGTETTIGVDANTAPGTDPVLPSGTVITVTGAQVAAGTIGSNVIRTNSLAASQFTIEIQRSTTNGSSDSTKNGVSHFNSAQFSVDANGYVSLAGGGLAIDSIETQTGTNPITPTAAGLVTINGAVVAAGTNPLRSNGTGANTMALEIQKSQAIAAADATKLGISNFNSSHFSVDADGFVSLASVALSVSSVGTQTGTNPIVPTAGGLITINGAVVAAGTNPIRSNGTGANTMAIEVQKSQSIAAADATKIGLCNFNSASFSVDADGFVSLASTGPAMTITGDTGGALATTANNWNILGSGSITTAGAASTLTVQLTGLTDHSVLVGAGTTTITKVAPSATSGVPLISQGAAADPAFGTALVPGGGTGLTSYSQGDILYASGATTLTTLAKSASATRYLSNTGASNNPAWAQVDLTNGVTGILPLANGGTGANLVDPNADRILFWDDSAGQVTWLTAGTGLSISGTTISATGGTGDVVGPGSSTDNAIARFDGTTGKLIQNSTVLIDDSGNITNANSLSGSTLSTLTSNTSNTANSSALVEARVAGTSGGDAYFKADISGGQNWTFGLDNSDSDAFVISANASLGTTNTLKITTAGEITMPLQPAFLAYLATTQTNKSGTGTLYTLGTAALTEVFDQGGDFVTSGTFTAPVTGRYQLSAGVSFTGCTSATSAGCVISSSNRNYQFTTSRSSSSADLNTRGSSLCDMDAADTAIVQVYAVGEAGDSDDVVGSSGVETFFSGFLAC